MRIVRRGFSKNHRLLVLFKMMIGGALTAILFMGVFRIQTTPTLYFVLESINNNNNNNITNEQQSSTSTEEFPMKHAGLCPVPDNCQITTAGLCPVPDNCQITTSSSTTARPIHEAWSTDPAAVTHVQQQTTGTTNNNQFTTIQLSKTYQVQGLLEIMSQQQQQQNDQDEKVTLVDTYHLMTRDPEVDTYISGKLRSGGAHDADVGRAIVQVIHNYWHNNNNNNNSTLPVILDVGTNIGYFTSMALALGAQVISFEPMRDNYGCVMATIQKNNHLNWQRRHYMYINAISFHGSIVTMTSTNSKINLSNGRVTNTLCPTSDKEDATTKSLFSTGQYGHDYMETASLDQIMLTRHADIGRIHLLKIDIETFEVNAMNGAVHLFCNRVIEVVLMEVEYLKQQYGLTKCDAPRMQRIMEQMGYDLWDKLPTYHPEKTHVVTNGARKYTGMPFEQLPTDVLFVLNDTSRPPGQRLKEQQQQQSSTTTTNNPCQEFAWPEEESSSWV